MTDRLRRQSVGNKAVARRLSREDDAAPAVCDRTAFKTAWSVLRRDGWFSKKPPGRSLNDMYRYVRSGCDPNGVAGLDYFLGGAALLVHYNKIRSATSDTATLPPGESSLGNDEEDNRFVGGHVRGEFGLTSNQQPGHNCFHMETHETSTRIPQEVKEVGAGHGDVNDICCESSGGISDVIGDTNEIATRDYASVFRDSAMTVGPDNPFVMGSGAITCRTSEEAAHHVAYSGSNSEEDPKSCGVVTAPANCGHLAVGATTNTAVSEPILCGVCGESCTTARSCSWCGGYLHHFCSHAVCKSLKLRGPDGEEIEDFGESCYCSKLCYSQATGSKPGSGDHAGVITTHHEGEIPFVNLDNIPPGLPPCSVSLDRLPTAARVAGVMNNVAIQNHEAESWKTAANPIILTGEQTPSKSVHIQTPKRRNTSVSKAPAKRQKNVSNHAKDKRKSVADCMKDELLRRTRNSAEKFVDANVAFSPVEENWMSASVYSDVGASYLIGIVTRYVIGNLINADGVSVPTAKFQLQWTNTAFQSKAHIHFVSEPDLLRGIKQYVRMQKSELQLGETWQSLCNVIPQLSNVPALTDEFEELDDSAYREWSVFRSNTELQIPLSPGEAEQIKSMTFSRTSTVGTPLGLFAHGDGATTSKIRQESRQHFGHSATSSFFAFVHLTFWNQVVVFSNEYAIASGNHSPKEISLEELMQFLGILWYMTLFDKGEMRNYWYDTEEATIFPGAQSRSLGTIMTWRRFLYIRQNLCFRIKVTTDEIKRDPAARIRPLINILKSRCSRHIIVGRNVAVDEASVACRSRYARHIIVYNPRKPTGKYHFKLYMCCCPSTWYAVNFKLHCSSGLSDRLDGITSSEEKTQLEQMMTQSSEVRSHVIEVTASLQGSSRIVNTDNFYTSCLLLESLRAVGLYGRGTVRASSKHFPQFTMIQKSDHKPRGFMKQGVCTDKHIVAASWVDGSIVNIVSNADASNTTQVYRRIKETREAFSAPTCISEYNSVMQGVDRHDQLRSRFSLSGGHSFKKWHKKLAMAFLDIARCNAFICDELARGNDSNVDDDISNLSNDHCPGRGRHRAFVIALVRELFSGEWNQWISSENGMAYSSNPMPGTRSVPKSHLNSRTVQPGQPALCVAKESWLALEGRSRAMRECTICKFECRVATQKTDFCLTHKVALCKRTYPVDPSKAHLCQEEDWTCWQKFHSFYMPKEVFTADGNVKRTSPIY